MGGDDGGSRGRGGGRSRVKITFFSCPIFMFLGLFISTLRQKNDYDKFRTLKFSFKKFPCGLF